LLLLENVLLAANVKFGLGACAGKENIPGELEFDPQFTRDLELNEPYFCVQ
jgi:hypothetical protein